MPNALHIKLAATAKRLIEKNGRAVDLFKTNRTPANPAQPWRGVSGAPTVPEGGVTIPSVIMAFVPAEANDEGFGKMINDGDGSLSVAFDQIGLLATDSLPTGITTLDVEQADAMRDGVDIWKIVKRGHLKPGDTSMIFALGLER